MKFSREFNFANLDFMLYSWESQKLNYKLDLYSFNNSAMLTTSLTLNTVKVLLNWTLILAACVADLLGTML